MPEKQCKKCHLGRRANGCACYQVEHKDELWAWDFIYDGARRDQRLNWLTLINYCTRQRLALGAGRRTMAGEVFELLAERFVVRGGPRYIPSSNSPECVTEAISRWRDDPGVPDTSRRAG